jgi:hypothetical protein
VSWYDHTNDADRVLERCPEKCNRAPFIFAAAVVRLWQYVHPRYPGVTSPLAFLMSGNVLDEEMMYEVSGSPSVSFSVWQLEQPLPPGSTVFQ